LSKDVKGYDKESNKYYWDNQKVAKLNTGIIHYLARIDSPEEYDKLNAKNYFKKDNEIECTTISKRYLLPNNVKKITTKVKSTCEDDNDVVLQKKIKEFFKDDNIKSFNLKSPYDTGKTQMIKTIINTYNPKRILWLSYRKTLTNDILGNFEKEYDFKDYQENEFDADRLIIQLESILKIECERNMFQDSSDEVYFKYPEYDLVLIDEIESILSHFNSPTFKGNSKTCFNFINNILCNSTKVITLDGDMGNRTYKFIERFGNSINVVNDITFDTKKFIIDEKEEHFYNEIKKDLKQNKKIVVVSMSSKKCDELEKKLCEDFKETKKILVYTGSADDKLKADFKDVKTKWSNCDVLIYSPTCESGVNFDAVHFDKMYGIFSTLSTTPRAYFQMLSRVRKFASNEVLILDLCFSTETVNPNRNFFNFNEVKESVMLLDTITLETSDIIKDGKIYKTTQLSPYDTNYIYNRAEQLNASKQYWLSYFAKLAINKGHTIKYLKNKIKSKKDEEVKEPVKNALIEIPNITEKVFKELLKKQKHSEATKEEKLKIKKHALKFHLGLDELNEDVIKVFDVQSVTNFTSLIDVKNIKEHDDNQTLETIDKSKIVNKLIKEIGFKNIFDQKKRIDKETFLTTAKQIIETNDMFKNIKNTQIRFNISKEKKCNTNKAFLGFVNTILDKYFLKIQYFKSNNKVFYKLEQLNNINELLGYKILKGYELHDSKVIRTESTTEQYKSLVDFEEIERIKLEEEENNKGDNDDEENKKMKTKQRREYNKVHK
jgi:hypothetical protein